MKNLPGIFALWAKELQVSALELREMIADGRLKSAQLVTLSKSAAENRRHQP